MKNTRKYSFLSLIVSFSVLFCGCVRNKRFDYSELNLRLSRTAPEFCFDDASLLFDGEMYFCFYSFSGENDTLFTLKEDETGFLERVTLTTDGPPGREGYEDFQSFALALAQVFIPDAETDRLCKETGLYDTPLLRENTLLTFTQVFYSAALLATDVSVTFVLQYG